MTCVRFQTQENEDGTKPDDYLESEDVQFANLEKSFREVHELLVSPLYIQLNEQSYT